LLLLFQGGFLSGGNSGEDPFLLELLFHIFNDSVGV